MKMYKVKIIETYEYEVEVQADSEKEALIKIKTSYESNDSDFDGVFLADATSFENVKFKISK